MSDIVDQTVAGRRETYGNSWLTPTLALDAITQGDLTKLKPLVDSGHFTNWFAILGKLCRAVNSPEYLDHWVDIGGYAKISIDKILDESLTQP